MGGKHWSVQEEEVFWTCVVPQSVKRLTNDSSVPPMSWDQLVGVMEAEMAARNHPPRRQYTGLGLFEHFFLNIDQRHYSPNARRFAQRYRRQRDLVEQNKSLEKNKDIQKTDSGKADPNLESAPVSEKKLADSSHEAARPSSIRVDQATVTRKDPTAPETPTVRVVRNFVRNRESRYHPFHPVKPRGRASLQMAERCEPERCYRPSQRDARQPLEEPACSPPERGEHVTYRQRLDRNVPHFDKSQYVAYHDSDHHLHGRPEDYRLRYHHVINPTHYQRARPDKAYYASPCAPPYPDERYEMSGALPIPSPHLHNDHRVSSYPPTFSRENQNQSQYEPGPPLYQRDPRANLGSGCCGEDCHASRRELRLPPVSDLLRIASRAPPERNMAPSPETLPDLVPGPSPSHRSYPAHPLPLWRETHVPIPRHACPEPAHRLVHTQEVRPVHFPEKQDCEQCGNCHVQRDYSTGTAADTTSDEGIEVTGYDGDHSFDSVPSSCTPTTV